jgi:hypothetical protein
MSQLSCGNEGFLPLESITIFLIGLSLPVRDLTSEATALYTVTSTLVIPIASLSQKTTVMSRLVGGLVHLGSSLEDSIYKIESMGLHRSTQKSFSRNAKGHHSEQRKKFFTSHPHIAQTNWDMTRTLQS